MLLPLALALLGVSCAPSGFTDPAIIDSVRILASSADQPYAKPGANVTVSVLAYDGRPAKPEPMTIYWIPVPCVNPIDDAYYACFPQIAKGVFAGGAGGAADGGTGSGIAPGMDLSQFLPTGPQHTFPIAPDAVTTHKTVPGTAVPYGVVIVFNIACAGHLELLPIDPNNINPQTVPLGCFDSAHNQLGADGYVFGFSRIYVYDTLTNANPVIDHVDVNGQTLAVTPDALGQLTTQAFVTPTCTGNCQSVQIGPVVPASSQEDNPEVMGTNGTPVKEEIWADFFLTTGSINDDARLLYDPTEGSFGPPSTTDDKFTPPSTSGSGSIWMVVHDDRGGASWVTVPVTVQ
jgi:hypothetical protein